MDSVAGNGHTALSLGPILSDNVPQEVGYSGNNYIEIKLAPELFANGFSPSTDSPPPSSPARFRPESLDSRDDDTGTGADDPPSGNDQVVLALDIDTPSDGAVLTGPSSGVSLSISGKALVTKGSDAIGKVEVQLGAATFEPATAGAGGWKQWTYAKTLTQSGAVAVKVRASNSDGTLTKTRQLTVTVVITADPPRADSTPPLVAITQPGAADALVLDGGTKVIEVHGTASDPESGVGGVEVTVDGAEVDVVPGDSSFANWSATATVIGTGLHAITAEAVNGQGLRNQARLELKATDRSASKPVVQRLLIVERCRLASFLGAYGPGRTIKTFSLLPGEKTRLRIESYKRSSTTAEEASSILDSYTTAAQDSFDSTLSTEQSNKSGVDESLKWHADVKASGSWGFGSASVDAGIAGASSASREELSKNISNAVSKHAAEKSAKRDVDVKSSRDVTDETGTDSTSESQIENINLSRTLNFVFRQMNQQFVSLLHLVDVRIAYVRADRLPKSGGGTELVFSYREVTLSQLDGLLEEVIVPTGRQDVRDDIMTILGNVFDYEDEQHSMVEEHALKDRNGDAVPNGRYLRVPKGKVSTYKDPVTGTELAVPGVILSVMTNVMRTDAILVDSLLGQGEALDDYSRGLQAEAVKTRGLENARAEAAIAKDALARQLVGDKNTEGAKIFEEVYPAPSERLAFLVAEGANGDDADTPS